MKISKLFPVLTFALAALVAAPVQAAANGDIVDIRVMDDAANLMVFGSARNSGSPYLCSADHPLTAGDKLYIRVRMLVRDYTAVRLGSSANVWSFKSGTLGESLINWPKLGLYMGEDRAPAWAEYSVQGPQAWQLSGVLKTDDLGNTNEDCKYYTDLYFCYTVRAGDLALPIRLLNSTGSGPASDSDVGSDYYLLNAQKGADYWSLSDKDGTVANFFYGSDTLPDRVDWPAGDASTAGPVRNFDLAAEGAYVKTIDFDTDDPNAGAGYWREVYEGLGPDTTPALTVVGTNNEAMVVYLWSSDESKVVLAASGANTLVSTTDGRTLLKVPVPAGETSVTFSMRGAAGVVEGDEAEIFMSPVANAVYRPTGELAGVTVSRRVRVGPPKEPTVRIFINAVDKVTDTKVAVPDYSDEANVNHLILRVTPTCPDPVTVRIKAAVSTDDTLGTLADIFDANILRIANPGFGGDPVDQRVAEYEIPANTATVSLPLYLLGATSKTDTRGVTFSLEKVSGPTSAQVPTDSNCTLKIRKTSKPEIVASVPEFTVGETLGRIEVGSGTAREFTLDLRDTYKNLNDAAGYTFTWKVEGEEIDPVSDVTADDDGQFVASVEFFNVTDGKELTLQVTAPNGTKSDVVKYWLVVNDGKYTKVTGTEERIVFCEGESTFVKLGLTQAYSGNGYIFLSADDPTQLAAIASPLTSAGAQIQRGRTDIETPREIRFLDGGKDLTLKAVLCSPNDLSRPVTSYGSGTIVFSVTNRPPSVSSVTAAGQYLSADMNGQALPEAISRGVVKTFSVVVDDVDADLYATGDDAMKVKWVIDGTTYETNDVHTAFAVRHTFANEKDNARIQVFVKDKDMTAYPQTPNFTFTAKIKDTPRVEILPTQTTYVETDKNVSQIVVALTEAASEPITVRFTVGQVADGYLKLRLQEGSVAAATDADGNEIPGAYDLTFGAGVLQKILIISDMDGTIDTMAGLDLNAAVTTESLNADGVAWKDFYTKAEPTMVQVWNAAPTILRPTDADAAYTNMNASANTPYAIGFAASDVTADLAAGVTVEINVDGVLAQTTTITDSTLHTYSAEFDGEGAHVVEIVFTDKDGDQARRTLNYFVKPSKRLVLRAHGPAGGVAGGHSERYNDAPGLGAGSVFAGSAGPQKVEEFVHTYSFGETEKSVTAYARGYRADGSYDNGSQARTKGIDGSGNWSKDMVIAPDGFYNYTAQNIWGRKGYDSFVYAWVCNNSQESSGGDSSGGQTETLKLNITDRGETVLALPDGNNQSSGSAGSSTTTTSYPMQYWEAVFSREFLVTDNAGDINQDGIPDCVVKKFGLGVIDPLTLQMSGDDLKDLSAYNEDADFLPAGDNAIYGTLIPGLKDDWTLPFTADLEIRGYGEGLNDALVQLGISGATPDRVYADPTTCPTSTLSRVEWLAWSEFKAANPTATEEDWSPERPTDPTKEDTDGDGFSDGYEYYYWYLAHVGYIDANGNHKYLTGRRYDPKNPGRGTVITSEEIASIMDPRVKYTGSDAQTRDSDNDGLPDLLEFELGTNPFDFDTDGDGLPDGWEIMIAGLDPLTAQSYTDGKSDTERNTDGDAMAISSYKLEQTEKPVPVNIEHAKRVTFAVINPNGDTDGVQWYAMRTLPTLDVKETFTGGYKVVVDVDGADVEFFSATAPTVVTDGATKRIAVACPVRTLVTYKPDEATEVKACGYPYTLPVGTAVTVEALAEEVKSYKIATAVAAKDANACWIYGKGSARAEIGEVAETAAEYGCLALARQFAVPAEAEIAALPSDERDVAFLHFLCYQEFGFDPRTAWCPNDPVAKRWGKSVDGEAVEGITVIGRGGYTGAPARTRAYANYDEFLVSSFFWNNEGSQPALVTPVIDEKAPLWARIWGALTTNPQGPNDAKKTSSDHYYGRDSVNGADTDGDGVPDGWELYVMAGPKTKDGAYVFAPPYAGFTPALAGAAMEESYLSPFVDAAKTTDTNNQIYLGGQENDDGLNEFHEFEGTDSMNYYAGYSTTIVHDVATDGEWKWFNKFFPTDPWSADTDGDGLSDGEEKKHFIYGTPEDNGTSRSIAGGGLNPCSVDTDCDGLPDGWEAQFAGTPGSVVEGEQSLGLRDGMDGTVKDASTLPLNTTSGSSEDGRVNRDYDHDGLENWQEYLTGTMRCWRYDDPVSPLTYQPRDFYFTTNTAGEATFDAAEAAKKFHAAGMLDSEDVNEFWYKTLVDASSAVYNPHLVMDTSSGAQYFSRVTNAWDAAYLDIVLSGGKATGAYYWFYDRVDGNLLKDTWGAAWAALVGDEVKGLSYVPKKYASCSPIDPDSDHDGMDDYYEVFHGMNPLLGESGREGRWWKVNDGGMRADSYILDLVYDSMYTSDEAKTVPQAWGSGSSRNFWQRKVDDASWTGKRPRGNGYDFEIFPWLNGLATADPDGDGIRNQEESIMALVSPSTAWHHSDPTPLWMTDSSYSNSLVRMNYRLPTRGGVIAPEGPSFTYEGQTYLFGDFDGFIEDSFQVFNPDAWDLVGSTRDMNWIASFEENEGFDTDHDGLNDRDEISGKYQGETDPLDVDSPQRRQAMYFQGSAKPSILQTMPFVREYHPESMNGGRYPDDLSFLQYTVECWVKAESLDDSTVIERAVYVGKSNPDDREFIRCNFRIGLEGGKWYTLFDPNDTTKESVKVFADDAATTAWTHLAATYDAKELVFYVDGKVAGRQTSGLQPTYGSAAVVVTGENGLNTATGMSYWRDREYSLHAIILGASVKTLAQGGNASALDVTQGVGFDAYTGFFKGYVDEVRIWDGARTATEIASAKMKRFTATDAAANRESFFAEWSKPGVTDSYRGRYAKDGSGNPYSLPAELRFHWSFDSLFGASEEGALATAPAGFNYLGENADGDGARALRSRPEGYGIDWWQKVLAGYAGTVYSDPAWICWVPNTVTHLPRYDGTTLDSIYWSEDFAGATAGTYKFARTAEPVSFWTQYRRRGLRDGEIPYETTSSRHHFVSEMDAASGSQLGTLFAFTGRHLNQTGDDMLALGGAFAKHVDDLWDGQGASANWEIAGTDGDGDGLPDWWEDLANDQYRINPTDEIGWDTLVKWPDQNGTTMTAGEAYLRDLARGYHGNAYGEAVTDEDEIGKYRQICDMNGNGLPDWWERLYGLEGESGLDDHDHDGLPNYVEYLLSEVFSKFGVKFDPTRADSVQPGIPDYFYKVGKDGDLYVGEIFTDHDLVDDSWEDLYDAGYASRLKYDPYGDADGDGWSNRSENRYAKQAMPIVADEQAHYAAVDGLVADYPIPTLALSVSYAGQRRAAVEAAPIVVQTYTDAALHRGADATFNIGAATSSGGTGTSSSGSSSSTASGTAYTRTLGRWSDRHAIGTLTPGYINKSSLSLEFCYDPSSESYSWTVGVQSNFTSSVIRRGTRAEYDAARRMYGDQNVQLISRSTDYVQLADLEIRSDESGKTATWIHTKSGQTLGTINLMSGAFDLDLGVFKGQYTVNSTNANDYASLEDQTFRIAYSANEAVGLPRRLYLGQSDTGHVREGKNTVIAFADLDGDGAYTAGEPYGCVTDVDISWKGTSVDLALTDTTPIFNRVDPIQGLDDRTVIAGTESGNYTNITTSAQPSGGLVNRIRVVRHMIIGTKGNVLVSSLGSDMRRVLLDLQVDKDVNPWITEANFLATGAFDVDWDTLYDDIVSKMDSEGAIQSPTSASTKYVIGDLTGVLYRIVIGNEDVDSGDAAGNMSVIVPVRRFDTHRNLPIPKMDSGVVTVGQPTFKWTMPYGANGYTAFKVSIKSASGSAFSWTSDFQRMPAADADGVYTWAAPVFVGDSPAGATGVFSNHTAYTWSVSAYNAKYKNDDFVTGGTFRMDVQTNGYSTGSIATTVRYYGPAAVTNDAAAVIRVRAYASPDFTGAPVGGGFVDKSVTNGVNCRLLGLPKGMYYLQAFIDSNGNGVCDKWESMGYLCQRDGTTANWLNPVAVTVGDAVGASEAVTIYLEDADTDGDNLPDAWEYVTATADQRKDGSFLTAKGVGNLTLAGAGEIAVDSNLTKGLLGVQYVNGELVPTAGLASEILTAFRSSASFAALMMGVAPNLTIGADGSLCQNPLVTDGTLAITGLAFDAAAGTVELTVVGDVTAPEAVASAIYQVKVGSTVTVKVLHTATLAGKWQEVATIPVAVSGDSLDGNVLTVKVPDVSATGGFYKVEIEQ